MNQILALAAIASGAILASGVNAGINLLRHHNFERLDVVCQCSLCTTWRANRDRFVTYATATEAHGIGCRCDDCRAKMKARSAYLSVLNKRNLICEMSWHMSKERCGPALMQWLWRQVVEEPEYKDSWWEREGGETPVISWVRQFAAEQRTIMAEASGAIVLPMPKMRLI